MKSAKQTQIRVSGEILKIVEIEVAGFNGNDHAPLFFRVELIKDANHSRTVTARVWRKEFYRIKPTFPQKRGKPNLPASDEVLLVEETSIFGEMTSLQSTSITGVLKKIFACLNAQLSSGKFKKR